jgi:hypothetical protein
MATPFGVLLKCLGGALLLAGSACTKTSSCSRDPDLVTVPASEGISSGNVYRSAPFGGPYQYFPPDRTISFEHGLGTVPYALQFWVAFTATGTLAPSAGNMTELRGADADTELALDAHRIAVHNDTCSDFYLWVVAEAPAASPLPIGSAGTGGADGAAGANP